MKKILAIFCAVVMMLALAACVRSTVPEKDGEMKKPLQETVEQTADTIITCPAQVIRTDGYHEEETYPQIAIIESAASLKAYVDDIHRKYALGCRESTSGDAPITFVAAIEGYDEAWFADHTLVLVVLQEGSGSNRHEVQGITAEGEILIKRIIPEAGTCDMAVWHVLLELPKDSAVLEKELTVTFVYGEGWGPPSIAASYASRYASVQVTLPGEGWEWEEIPDTGGDEPFGIRFWPARERGAAVELCCHPQMIGLCGTGLSTEEVTLENGSKVFFHSYDAKPWFLAYFDKTAGNYYATRSTDNDTYDEQIREILRSAVLGSSDLYDKMVALAARESGTDYEYATARFDINTGFWTVYLGKINTAGGDAEVIINDLGGIESITHGE